MEPRVFAYVSCAAAFLVGAAVGAAIFFAVRRRMPIPRSVLERVLGWMDVCVVVNDAKSCELLYVNPKARAHFGLGDEAVGRHYYDLFGHCCESTQGFCPRELLAGRPADIVGAEIKNLVNGRYYRQSGFLVEWRSSKREAQLVCLTDITDAMEAREAAERANLSKSTFLARVSQEIRAPMNDIIGMVGAALSAGDGNTRDDYMKKIDAASHHLMHVINEILDISKIEANTLELTLEVFDTGETLNRVLSMLEWRISNKKRDFTVEIDDIPLSLIGDGARLSQILVNLLGNAERFTPEGGKIALRVKNLEENSDTCGLQFEVEDSGPGVSEETRGELFDAFEGGGMGLAISKRLVEMMCGRMWVESRHGKGAKFTFTVRLYKNKSEVRRLDTKGIVANAQKGASGAPQGDDYWDEMERRIAERRILERRASGKPVDWSSVAVPEEVKRGKRRVLLAEDVEAIRDQVTSYFDGSGIPFDLAENGAAACRMFAEDPTKYFLVLMDTQMPAMDGYEATRKIRAMSPAGTKKVPIIGMLANAFQEDIDQCFAAGMGGHVEKPLDMATLRETVLRVIDLEFRIKGQGL